MARTAAAPAVPFAVKVGAAVLLAATVSAYSVLFVLGWPLLAARRHWRRALVATWLVVFIAALAAVIYREVDGPSLRAARVENLRQYETILDLETQLRARDAELRGLIRWINEALAP